MQKTRGTGSVGRNELAQRADLFAGGRRLERKRFADWPTIFGLKRKAGAMSSKNSRGEARAGQSRVERGQVSRARQELTGAALAPKNSETLRELQRRRPQDQMSEIPRDVLEFQPAAPFQLDESLFVSCLKSARSGCSPGPGGCTNEMLRVCLDDAEVLHLLFRAREDFARGISPRGNH